MSLKKNVYILHVGHSNVFLAGVGINTVTLVYKFFQGFELPLVKASFILPANVI